MVFLRSIEIKRTYELATVIAIRQNACSIGPSRHRVFTQPRPIPDVASGHEKFCHCLAAGNLLAALVAHLDVERDPAALGGRLFPGYHAARLDRVAPPHPVKPPRPHPPVAAPPPITP